MKTDILEKYGPWTLGLTASIVSSAVTYNLGLDTISAAMVTSFMTVGIVIAGFSATLRIMIFSMRNSRVIARLGKIQHRDQVLGYLSKASFSGIGLTLVAFVGFFIPEHQIGALLWISANTLVFFLSIGYLIRNEFVMHLIVKRYMEE